MLPLPIALLVGVGPLVGGGAGLAAQTLLLLAAAAGAGLWLLTRVAVGHLPIPSGRGMAWTAALAILSGLSAAWSPVPASAGPAWRSLLLGLWLFPALAVLGKDGRAVVDQAARAAGWVLFLLAGYQRLRDGVSPPPGPMPSPEALAAAALLLLALAVQVKDWILAFGLLLTLVWAGGLGAWMGLAAALLLFRRRVGEAGFRLGAAIGFVCLVVLYASLESRELLDRWGWWSAAAAMVLERPALGFGPGAFGSASASFLARGAAPAAFAHQHWLELAAECGLPFAALWLAGALHCLRRGSPHKRFGAAAVLVQGFWDPGLSTPAVFWLLCYFLASTGPETSRAVDIPLSRKAPTALLVCALSAAAGWSSWGRWRAAALKSEALRLREAGAPASEVLAALDASARRGADPEVERLAAELEGARGDWAAAARRLEAAAALDPYRPALRAALERARRKAGRSP